MAAGAWNATKFLRLTVPGVVNNPGRGGIDSGNVFLRLEICKLRFFVTGVKRQTGQRTSEERSSVYTISSRLISFTRNRQT